MASTGAIHSRPSLPALFTRGPTGMAHMAIAGNGRNRPLIMANGV